MFLFSYKMSFRTVLINKASRINLDLNNIVVFYEDDKFYINLDDINTIVIEDPRCSISLRLLVEICKKGINFILTDKSHMPVGCVSTLYNHTRASKKILSQINWQFEIKQILWTKIVETKIENQIQTLIKLNKYDKIDMLTKYKNSVELGDITNREGLTSRIYFKELFGYNFKRFNYDVINFTLNYIYQIVRAKISQEIVVCGYISSIGICHKSEYNQFNLADDFIEVFRPILDFYVYKILLHSTDEFLNPDLKESITNILNEMVIYQGKKQKIRNCITFFLQNIFFFIETGDINKLEFPKLE